MKRIAALLTAAAMICSPLGASALEVGQAEGYARGIIAYEKQKNGIKPNDSLLSGRIAENAGSESSDWLMMGAVRFGLEEDTSEYYGAWTENMSGRDIGGAKATEGCRAVLTALCIGADPSDISDIDLLAECIYYRGENNSIGKQGLNGWIWALIALDSFDWKAPEDAGLTRVDIVNTILAAQNEDGGFSIEPSVGESDPDLTAMAVQALSPYRNCDEVKEVAARAVDYLADVQEDFGSCETAAQTVCALCCMGIDPDEDERFDRLTDTLISYANDDGGFAHEKGGDSSELASAQALIALCSLSRLRNGERAVYDMNEGAPQQSEVGTLAEVAGAKERNTSAPRGGGVSPSEEKSGMKIYITVTAAIVLCAMAAGGILLKRRKERTR